MAFGNIRSDYLPYCVKRVKAGRYVILNREYKPVGQRTSDIVKYEDHMARIKGLTAKRAGRISVHGDEDRSVIYLYNDDCIPERSEANMAAYLARLGLLARLKVEDPDCGA